MRITRPATIDDAEEIVRLARVMFESMAATGAAAPEWQTAGVAAVRERLGDDLGVFVVDHPAGDGRLIASAAATIARRLPTPYNPGALAGYVQWVATDPAHRRQGHGRAVMEALLEWLVDRGVRAVELHATADGEPLYRSLGFAPASNPHLRWHPLT